MGRSRKKGQNITGWLVLDKPLGMTSTQALGKVRWLLDAKKAGHAGTLDPLASGVLPLAFGEATKTIPFMMDAHKTYAFTIQWGASTTTLDAEGAVTARSDHRPSAEEIKVVLPGFVGQIEQTPPAFSAIKVDGKRAYDLARAGEEVVLKSRTVRIDALHLVDVPDADHACFEVQCGKGTYVRSLMRDIAAALGCEGHVTVLRRTRVGPFEVDAAIRLDEVIQAAEEQAALDFLQPLDAALGHLARIEINAEQASDLRMGRAIVCAPMGNADTAQPLVYAHCATEPIALGTLEGEIFKPSRVFNP